jgi:predicted HAD superfamily Cof-like phosphohydrolase
MTIIVLEGPDNSGKSTLAKILSEAFNIPVKHSEGREKYPGEINERVKRYLDDPKPIIYDRHPVVSQLIYSLIVKNTKVDDDLIDQFYREKPIFIYCKALNRMNGHINKDYDEPEYVKLIDEKYDALTAEYDDWALNNAHLIYRIGDSVPDLLSRVIAFNPVLDVALFHQKFGLAYEDGVRALPEQVEDFRIKFMHEELDEYVEAMNNHHLSLKQPGLSGYEPQETLVHLEKAFDGLIDLAYVLFGTSYLHGFPFIEGWRRVHAANMAKVRATDSSQSKRGSALDVVKPEGWKAPVLMDLLKGSI